jgi:cell division protein ZapA
MASVNLIIGGNPYSVACRDGEEPHLQALAAIVDAKATEARGAVGGVSEVRQMLLAALLLADELNDLRSGVPVPVANDDSALEKLADKLEDLAARLEKAAANA